MPDDQDQVNGVAAQVANMQVDDAPAKVKKAVYKGVKRFSDEQLQKVSKPADFDEHPERYVGRDGKPQLFCCWHGLNPSHEAKDCHIIKNENHMRENKPRRDMPFPKAVKTFKTKEQIAKANEKRKLDMVNIPPFSFLLTFHSVLINI